MSWPGWALPTFAAAIVGLGLLGINSYFDHPYFDTDTRSASRPIMPVLSSADEGSSPAQQPSEKPTPTSLPAHVELPTSEDTVTAAEPWVSEAMETASREPVGVESDKVDGSVEGDALLRGTVGDHANLSEGSVSSEAEPSLLEPMPTQSTAPFSRDPAQTLVDLNTDPVAQEAPTSIQAADLPVSPATPSPPSPPPVAGAWLPQDRDPGEEAANAKPKRVWLVGDPSALGEALATGLKREPDFEVIGKIGSPAECANFVSAEQGLDVAIVGLFLPDAQGLSLVEGLRGFCPHVPMLVLTPSLDPTDQERALKAGADAVLGKDAALEELVSTLRRLSPN